MEMLSKNDKVKAYKNKTLQNSDYWNKLQHFSTLSVWTGVRCLRCQSDGNGADYFKLFNFL